MDVAPTTLRIYPGNTAYKAFPYLYQPGKNWKARRMHNQLPQLTAAVAREGTKGVAPMNSKFTWPYPAAPSTGITIDCLEDRPRQPSIKAPAKSFQKKEFMQLSPAVAMLHYTGTNSQALITATALV